MKICIVSDSHDRGDSLARAIAAGKAEGATAVIHCGDIIGTNTLKASLAIDIPQHVIHGNNLGDPASLGRLTVRMNGRLAYYGQDATLELGGRRLFVVHYPEYGEAMALTGRYDVVCVGHSHEPEVRTVRNVNGTDTWLVNPGTVAGLGAPASTWILGDLATCEFTVRAVPPA
ncbi:MAG TPA: YfcE family phosphodiesterase [Rhodocyclaceae bacterium]